jgi:hypothetical protein
MRWGFAFLLVSGALGAQDKPKPTAEDKKPFDSSEWLFTIKKPSGKELDWAFSTERLSADAAVRVEFKSVMNLFLVIRGQKPQPNQKLIVNENSAKQYEDSVMQAKNFKNQKKLKNQKIQWPTTGDECYYLEFSYELQKSPDVFELRVWMFVAKTNGIRYLFELYAPTNRYAKLKSQIDSMFNSFQTRAK